MKNSFFNANEKNIWQQPEIFLTKKLITDKIFEQSNSIAESIKLYNQEYLSESLSPEIILSNIKISKGENHNGLPWVMCDYPSIFSQQSIFAFRLFYWWGKQINCFFLLHGEALNQFLPNIQNNIFQPKFEKILFSINENPWNHIIDDSSYKNLQRLTADDFQNHISNFGFIKLAASIDATNIDETEEFAKSNWELFSTLLK